MTATFYVGDVLDVLGKLPENSVDLILSSPPFLALRSYLPADHPLKDKEGGSQSTPGEYIDWLLDVVEACDRVLAPHGSLCLELGDTYSGSGGAGGDYAEGALRAGQPAFIGSARTEVGSRYGADPRDPGRSSRGTGGNGWPLPKSLSLIPESFRFAMVYGFNPFTGRQTERWRLRNVIRWVRPNPPVGALGDKFRPATSELMVFCKSAKRFFDLDSVREPFANIYDREAAEGLREAPVWNGNANKSEAAGTNRHQGLQQRKQTHSGAPPLDWWNIPPGGYEGAHYAVWPPELLIKPIKAMCPEKVCRECGEARRRITDVSYERNYAKGLSGIQRDAKRPDGDRTSPNAMGGKPWLSKNVETLGFTDCGHNDYRPGLVLDPFVGSGTTLAVATGHGRDAIGIDLDERNFDLALERVGPLVLQRGEQRATSPL